jgi:hypothetical protein
VALSVDDPEWEIADPRPTEELAPRASQRGQQEGLEILKSLMKRPGQGHRGVVAWGVTHRSNTTPHAQATALNLQSLLGALRKSASTPSGLGRSVEHDPRRTAVVEQERVPRLGNHNGLRILFSY